MKRFIVTLVCMFFAYTVKAQDITFVNDEVSSLKIAENSTSNYFNSVNNVDAPTITKELQNEVLKFNIETLSDFSKTERSFYTVTFKRKQGNITATYNSDGELISTNEHYKNIALPLDVRIKLAKKYPQWEFGNNHLNIKYNNGIASYNYSVTLLKNNKKQTIRFNR